jgi:hypothetical protein
MSPEKQDDCRLSTAITALRNPFPEICMKTSPQSVRQQNKVKTSMLVTVWSSMGFVQHLRHIIASLKSQPNIIRRMKTPAAERLTLCRSGSIGEWVIQQDDIKSALPQR